MFGMTRFFCVWFVLCMSNMENLKQVPNVPQKSHVNAKSPGLHSGKMLKGMGVLLG